MKLKNKNTGEIATLTLSMNGEDMIIMGNDMYAHITKLSELKDYEDYEGTKEYWYIDYDGGISCGESDNSSAEKMMISMGNHFDTLEDANKAVEKLKAWKRLKDGGFYFTIDAIEDGECKHNLILRLKCNEEERYKPIKECEKYRRDIHLIFGGEE